MTHLPTTTDEAAAALEPEGQSQLGRLSPPSRSPITWFLDLFSSIWLGITLMSILFVYCAIGSVGIWLPGEWHALLSKDWVHEVQWFIMWTQVHVRQSPALELTEFEWFHWWPFNLLIGLICLNVVVATLRRIPLNIINLGVWMIHTGILILAAGSVLYFTLKLEGETPVIRRMIVAEVDGHAPVVFAAQPGAIQTIQLGEREYTMWVMNTDPHWELLSGEDAGKRAYSISVAVQTPEHEFIRQLIAGYPQYTEDTIWIGRQDQPMVRAVRELGRPLVDDSIKLSLTYHEQEHFYLMDSRALYLREKGEREWARRPIHGLPRYSDRLDSFSGVWPDGRSDIVPNPIEIALPATDPRDPMPDSPVSVTSYLRYAAMESRHVAGGEELNPMLHVRLRGEQGEVQEHHLEAFDETSSRAEGGHLHFVWAASQEEFDDALRVEDGQLRVRIAEVGVDIKERLPWLPASDEFVNVEGSNYAYRIERIEGPLNFGDGRPVWVAIFSIQTPDRTFQRWVFDNPERAPMDFEGDPMSDMQNAAVDLDESIEITFTPPRKPSRVTVIAGPEESDLHLLLAIGQREPSLQRLTPRTPTVIHGSTTLEALGYSARVHTATRPLIIPPAQRDRDQQQSRSVIRVHVPTAASGAGGESVWLPHHFYAFASQAEAMRRFLYSPTEVTLEDGRVIEMIYSRDRQKLPAPVVLEDFEVKSHIGGFTGDTSSVRDWVSLIRFQTGEGWTDPEPVSMNKPGDFRGFWFFQSKWDPPEPARGSDDVPSAGLNYTVLGVGNRHGVWIQLFGCCVAVAGMIYAFYIKPILKRRRQQAVYAALKVQEVNESW